MLTLTQEDPLLPNTELSPETFQFVSLMTMFIVRDRTEIEAASLQTLTFLHLHNLRPKKKKLESKHFIQTRHIVSDMPKLVLIIHKGILQQ